MKRNYYNPKTHIGNQPIRVLKWNIACCLEKTHPHFKKEYEDVLSLHNLKPSIIYDTAEAPIYSTIFPYSDPIPEIRHLTPHVDNNKNITIQETFLSYLWIMCYFHLVTYGEIAEKIYLNRLVTHKYKINTQPVIFADLLCNYGRSLITRYTVWNKELLPNPELYDDSDIYIEKTNSLFVHAVNFVLLHEFAHIKLGHMNPNKFNDSNEIRKRDEQLADSYAINTMLAGAFNSKEKLNRILGMTIGLGALLLLFSNATSNTHPASDDRLETLLTQLKLDDMSKIWLFASLSIIFWDQSYKKDIIWPREAKSSKDLFYLAYDQLRVRNLMK